MADAFISYAREDRQIAERLTIWLAGIGYRVWWDRNLIAGARVSHAILEQLNLARVVFVIWSRHSVDSVFVEDEARVGSDAGKLIPLRTADLAVDQIPLGFRGYHTEFVNDFDGIARALHGLGLHARPGADVACNMFTFHPELGELSNGITAVERYSHRFGKECPAIQLEEPFSLGEDALSSSLFAEDVVWAAIDDPPTMGKDGCFLAGSILFQEGDVAEYSHTIHGYRPGCGAIVRVNTGAWPNLLLLERMNTLPRDTDGMPKFQNHGSALAQGGSQYHLAGRSIGGTIMHRRNGLFLLAPRVTILAKGCIPGSTYYLLIEEGEEKPRLIPGGEANRGEFETYAEEADEYP